MNKALLLGTWKYILPVPRPIWQRQVAREARQTAEYGLDFMTEEHHRVRNFAVLELPRVGKPLSPTFIAERTNLPVARVTDLLDDLEKHLTFLYRNPQGEVAWAYPVTIDRTPHRITFSSGEQTYAA
jgi:hypothetical protein